MHLDVLVAIPSTDRWSSDFGMSICQLVADFASKIEGYNSQRLRLLKKESSILPNMREEIGQTAIAQGVSHVLFLDTDQTFPQNTLRRLLAWKESIVAANIAVKTFPTGPTARLFNRKNPKGDLLYTWSDSVGLVPVWRVGTGVMLIETRVFRRVPEPWFPVVWREEVRKFQGEDWGFCEKVEAFGFKPMVDQGLSWEIGHVGKCNYKHDLVVDPQDFGKVRPTGVETESRGPLNAIIRPN
jgi:hypothetical protein